MSATTSPVRPELKEETRGAALQVRGVSARVKRGRDRIVLLDDVSLSVRAGRCTAVIGESGSGKSTLLKTILRTAGRDVETEGEILVDGELVSALGSKEFARVRGTQVALVAQNALAALDPLFAVGKQIAYLAEHHGGLSRQAAEQRALDLLTLVALPEPERVYHVLPHQLSGGMRQRCVLAMAMACGPKLLLADEPTTALDVITQAKALALLLSMQRDRGMGVLFVTHDIGVAATVADDVVVLYAGRIVEHGPAAAVLTDPQHPYTRGLVAANQPPGPGERWSAIGGEPPRPGRPHPGCAFESRCAERLGSCASQRPPAVVVGGAEVFCHARVSPRAGSDTEP